MKTNALEASLMPGAFVCIVLCIVLLSLFSVKEPTSKDRLQQLHTAIANGNIDTITNILQNTPSVTESRFKNPFGSARRLFDLPILSVAVQYSQMDVVNYFLDQGSDPNEYGNNMTALHLATRQGDADMVSMLLTHGADPDLPGSKDNSTALAMAASRGYVQICKQLIDAGASIEKDDDFGRTPLMYAAVNGKNDVVNLLVQNGGKPETRSNAQVHNKNAREMAHDRGHIGIVKLLDKITEHGNRVGLPVESKKSSD